MDDVGRIAQRREVNLRIGAAVVTVGLYTLLVAVAGALRDFVVARQFGTSRELDAFLIAFLLPSFAISVVGGALTTAFLPTYVAVRESEGPPAAQRLLSSVVMCAVAGLCAVSLLLAAGGYYLLPLVGSGFDGAQLQLCRRLFFLLAPLLVVKGVATIWGSVLNAGGRFALVAFAPALVPICAIAVLIIPQTQLGIYSLAFALILGYALEACLLGVALRRLGFTSELSWHGMTPAIRQIARQYAPMLTGSLLMSSTMLVDQSMAAALKPGSVSILHFGNKIVALVISVGSISLGSALFPHYSRMVAQRDWEGVRMTLRTYSALIVLLSFPLLAVLVLLREPLVGLLFQRGAFTAAATIEVSRVQMFYAFQIPAYLLATVLVRLISSLNANDILMWGAAINLPLDVALNYALIPVFGVAGIALSTSLMYTFSCCFSAAMLARRLRLLSRSTFPGDSA